MKAIIEGIEVYGTPKEIKQYQELSKEAPKGKINIHPLNPFWSVIPPDSTVISIDSNGNLATNQDLVTQ